MKKNKHHNKLTLFAIMFVLATLMGCPNKKAAPKKTAAAKKSIKHAPKKKKGLSIDEDPDTVEEDIVEEEDKNSDDGNSDDVNSDDGNSDDVNSDDVNSDDGNSEHSFFEIKDEAGKIKVAYFKAIIASEFDTLPPSFGVLYELLQYLLGDSQYLLGDRLYLEKDTLITITKKAATIGLEYYLGDNELGDNEEKVLGSAMREIFCYAAAKDLKEIAEASLAAMKKQSWYNKHKNSKHCIAAVNYLTKRINFNYENGAYPSFETNPGGDDSKVVETTPGGDDNEDKDVEPNPKGENKEDETSPGGVDNETDDPLGNPNAVQPSEPTSEEKEASESETTKEKEVRSDVVKVLIAMGKKAPLKVDALEETLRTAKSALHAKAKKVAKAKKAGNTEAGNTEEEEKAVSDAKKELALREAYDYFDRKEEFAFLVKVILQPNDAVGSNVPSEGGFLTYLETILDFLTDEDNYPENVAKHRVEVIKTGINDYLTKNNLK